MRVLGVAEILEAREALLAEFRGTSDEIPGGVLNLSCIEAAVERARNGPSPPGARLDAFLATAFLLRGITQEHAFPDGNKRTGWAVANANLAASGLVVLAEAGDAVAFMKAIAEGRLELLDIAAWLRE